MKIISFVFIFIFIYSCTSKPKVEITVDDLKKEGTLIYQSKKKTFSLGKDIKNINRIELYKKKKISKWASTNYNMSHLVPNIYLNHSKFKFVQSPKAKKNKNNLYKKNIILSKKYIIYVDDHSFVHILNKDLSIFDKFQIYKKKEYKNFFFKFSLTIDDNTLFITDNFGTLLSYNLNTKKINWKNYLNTPFVSNITFFKGDLFVLNSNGKIFSFNSADGKQKWSFDSGSEYTKSYKAFRISVSNNKLIFTNDSGMLLCIDLKKNTLLWNKVLIPSKNFTGLNVIKFSDVVIENNYAYILSNFSNFIKVDINSGNIIWSIPLNSNHRPLVSINNIVFVDETNNIIIVDKISGKLFFKKNLNFKNQKNKIEINSLFFISNSIHIFGNDGSLFKIEVSNLSDIKYEKLPNAINSNIAISSNDLFFIGNKNKIFKTR